MNTNFETLKSELRVGARIMANLPIECGVLWIDDTEAKRIAKTMSDALAAIKAQQAEPAQAVRMLTQQELDALGANAEGLDGDTWDRMVQDKFCRVNAGRVIPADGEVK